MLLTEGSADTRMISDEGRELMIEHLYAPQLLALVFLFSTKGVMPVDVIAHTECCVWYINREAFLNFMIGQPQVLKSFLQVLSDRGQFLSGKVQSFAVKGLRNRVLDYLTLQGSITSVTQVALQLGVARPSLSRVLAEMTTDGIIVNSMSDCGTDAVFNLTLGGIYVVEAETGEGRKVMTVVVR